MFVNLIVSMINEQLMKNIHLQRLVCNPQSFLDWLLRCGFSSDFLSLIEK